MKNNLCEIFGSTQRFESEIHIGDYTEYVKTHQECPYRGVVMSNMPLVDIDDLHFSNPIHIPVLGINFEENSEVFDIGGGRKASNCECMLVSDKADRKGWIALAELKYCTDSEKAVVRNMRKAISQMESTFLHLRDVVGCFGNNDYTFYWIVSMPEHGELIPFSAFLSSPEDLLEYKDKYGVNIFTDNRIRILSHERIML